MIRFILIFLVLLLSLLSVFRAPTYHLWLASIAVTEFPLLFSVIAASLFIWSRNTEKGAPVGMLLSLATLLLFISPVIRAYIVNKDLKNNFESAFGSGSSEISGPGRKEPLSLGQMLSGVPKQDVVYKTHIYNKGNDPSLTLDFYPSQLSGRRPCVIVVHGGSWSSGDSKQLPELNSYLASVGYNVASINYRMAPQFQNPAPVQDIESAMHYLKTNSWDLNIDTGNFVLLGRSAGAQIALLAAYTLPQARFKGVVDFYGPADMVWGYSIPSNPLIMDSRKVMGDYLGGTYSEVPQNFVASSPIEFVTKQSPPTLIIHGQNDVLVSPLHSSKLQKKLTDNGVKNFFLSLPWATHGFDFTLNGPGGQLSTFTIECFLKQVTK